MSQTPWFRDWLRRYIVRESKQYLNGELSIGRLDGNLLFGVQVSDVAVDVSGERVVAVKGVEVDYSVFQLISKGIVLNEIKLVAAGAQARARRQRLEPRRLVKEQEKEADRKGRARPVSLPVDRDHRRHACHRRSARRERLPAAAADRGPRLKASFEYAPVHYTVASTTLSFRGIVAAADADRAHRRISRCATTTSTSRRCRVKTGGEHAASTASIEEYLATPVLKLTTTGNVSLPEIGRVVPAAAGYALHPAFEIKAIGPGRALALDLNVRVGGGQRARPGHDRRQGAGSRGPRGTSTSSG